VIHLTSHVTVLLKRIARASRTELAALRNECAGIPTERARALLTRAVDARSFELGRGRVATEFELTWRDRHDREKEPRDRPPRRFDR
jgi:hypothetical protein